MPDAGEGMPGRGQRPQVQPLARDEGKGKHLNSPGLDARTLDLVSSPASPWSLYPVAFSVLAPTPVWTACRMVRYRQSPSAPTKLPVLSLQGPAQTGLLDLLGNACSIVAHASLIALPPSLHLKTLPSSGLYK